MKIFINIFLVAAVLFSFRGKINTMPNYKISAQDSTIKIDTTTSLIIAKGYEYVTAHCTGCHSSKLIVNYGANKNGWKEKIRWMQKTQKLWDLGEAEPIILDYLALNYGPKMSHARREPLKNINWYILKK